jgi:cation:H+ antiporter
MVLVLDLLMFFLGCVLLVKSASLLVNSATRLAIIFKVTEFAIGFILVAFSTSLPELFVGIISSFQGLSSFVLGNVIGSNIVDLTLIIGIAVLVKNEINIYSKMVIKNSLFMLFITIVPILLMLDQSLNQLDGVILIILFIFYMWRLFKQERRFEKKMEERVFRREKVKYFVLFAASIFMLWLSSQVVITSAEGISIAFGIPEIMIGLILLAFGTSLPELIFTVKATIEHEYLAVGDILGSVITNSTLVLGISAIIHPIEAGFLIFLTSMMFMVMSAFLFTTFVESERNLRLKEGVALILLYVIFLIVEFNVQMFQSGVIGCACP